MLTPIFDFNNDSVCLYRGIARVTRNNVKYGGTAKIILKFSPKAHLLIHTEFLHPQVSGIINDEMNNFTLGHHKLEVFPISSRIVGMQRAITKIDWIPSSEPINKISNSRKKSKRIIFHIFNFINFMGADSFINIEGDSSYRLAFVDLEYKNFKIKIQELIETSDNIKYAKENGCSKITHVGSVEKAEGLISKDEYAEIALALKYFLSFAKGSWINHVCSVGFATTNEPIWYEYSSPNTDWKSLSSWFGEHNGSSLKELFPLFMNKWDSERWKDTFKEVIYWFLNANDGARGVDAGLILAQTALERLSYEYVVYEKKLLSTKGFKDIWASDKFRLLFSSLSITLNIPSSLSALTKKSKEMNWLDAPHALTEIRNSLVHPEHKKHGKFDIDIFYEAHLLSLWYLEMSILAICEFNGVYSNRLVRKKHIGIVENVPWVNEII